MAPLVMPLRRRQLPPAVPPLGPLDVAVSLLLHRAFPFNETAQALLQRRLGWPVSMPCTQTEAAAAAGVTQQWVARLEQQLSTLARTVGPPVSLTAAVQLLADGETLSSQEAASTLLQARLATTPIHPASLRWVAEHLFGVPVGFTTMGSGEEQLVVPDALRQPVERLPVVAKAMARRYGIAGLGQLADEVGVPETAAAALLQLHGDFGVEGDDWWRAPDASGGQLPRALARMLAVGPQTLGDLREGLAIVLRYHQHARLPTRHQLTAYLRSQPVYRVEGDVVRAVEPLRPGLTGTDRAMLRAFEQQRVDELPVSALYAALRAAGYGGKGAAHLVQMCPVLRRMGYGRYEVRRLRPARSTKERLG